MNEVLDYRAALRRSLERRSAANANYSLRAFARDLKIAPSHLSLILSGKRGLSAERANEVFQVLGLSPDEKRIYLLQVKKNHSRSTQAKQKAKTELAEQLRDLSHFQLSQDAFEVISDWYHFAILQTVSLKACLKLKSFRDQEKFLAERLVVSEENVTAAIARLLRLNLLSRGESVYQIEHDTVFAMSGVPSSALRQFHRSVLQKAMNALEEQTVEERYPNTIILPVLKESFPFIKEEMVRFNKKIMKKYGRNVQKDGEETYALTQHFLKLTASEGGKK